jgi:hypothetical protein
MLKFYLTVKKIYFFFNGVAWLSSIRVVIRVLFEKNKTVRIVFISKEKFFNRII